jgi:putative FmdB family regulatory protein
MPLYEYQCSECHLEFEALVRNPDETPQCPACGDAQLQKLLSVPAAHSTSADLPMCSPPSPGGCGQPACGMGGCQMM